MATSKKRTPKPGKNKKSKAVVPPQPPVEDSVNPEESQEELQRDVLDDFLFHAANYIYVRRKLFISLAVAVAVIMVSVYGGFRFIQYRENIRNEELFAIEKIINNSTIQADQRSQKVLPLLNRFLELHSDTRQSVLALLYRGGILYSNKNYAGAEADFQAIRASQDSDSEIYILASIYLSNVLRDQKKTEQALEILKSAQSDKLTDVILMEMAELYMQSSQVEKAKETLNILVADFPKSPYATRAQQMLKLL